jgi:membrane protease YdiL (CAAX protease family)
VIEDALRTFGPFIALGLAGLLVLHRLEAEVFGAAEYDETRDGSRPSLRRRLSWYVVGVLLIAAVVWAHPDPGGELHLQLGDRLAAVVYGFAYAAIGTAQAIAFAWWRYRRIRLPSVGSYPDALANAVATAFIDEAAFRGVVLGFAVMFVGAAGRDPILAVLISALLYVLVTRAAARGRPIYTLYLTFGIGMLSGWLTLATGGIGAAFLGHAITRFAVFLCTGHAGSVTRPGTEAEEIERKRRPPDGWRVVGHRS